MLVRIVIGLVTALLVSWLVITVVLLVVRPKGAGAGQIARFLPEVLRLVRSLYRDPDIPRSARWRLWVALAYDVQPFNLIPDFVPVVGFADNVVVTAWALRSTIRKVGRDVVVSHWHGSPGQLAMLFRIARLGPPPPDLPPADPPTSDAPPPDLPPPEA